MEEVLSPEEQVVKDHNIEKGIEKEEEITEKEIDGETWVKKEKVVEVEIAEIEAKLRTIIGLVKKGRTDQEVADILRAAFKKLVYPLESKEPRER